MRGKRNLPLLSQPGGWVGGGGGKRGGQLRVDQAERFLERLDRFPKMDSFLK